MERKCYLIGPMRSKPEYNYPAFMRAAEALRAAGWYVYNPAEMDREEDGTDYSREGHTLAEQFQMASNPVNARRFACRDIGVVLNKLKAGDGDAIVMLPDWEESIGAKAERAVGVWVSLQILPLDLALALGGGEWLSSQSQMANV